MAKSTTTTMKSGKNKKQPQDAYNLEQIKNEEIVITFFVTEKIEKPHCIKNDKRYEEPFEDDGAYAD